MNVSILPGTNAKSGQSRTKPAGIWPSGSFPTSEP